MSVNQRLIDYAAYSNLNQHQIRKALGIKSRQQVSNWFNDQEKIPDKVILRIIETYKDLNARWFITGEEEMFIPGIKGSVNEVNEPNWLYSASCEKCRLKEQTIVAQQKTIATLEKLVSSMEGNVNPRNGTSG